MFRKTPGFFVKIDVEGYEQRVLAGFETLLARESVVVFAEITDAWLRDLGGSAEALFDAMRARGFPPSRRSWTGARGSRSRSCTAAGGASV